MKKARTITKVLLLLTGLPVLFTATSQAATQQIAARDFYIPTTISEPARQALQEIAQLKIYTRTTPPPGDLDAWRKAHDAAEEEGKERNRKALERSGITITEARLGGVPVLDIRPREWKNNGKVLVYTHGGGYTFFSARSSLTSSAPMSRATGLRVISIDYTTAPFATWKEIQGQVISVFKALLAKGYTMKDIALYGDSAGGGLAISTVLNLRDRGLGMPAAVVLWSPWADLTNAGDTPDTLKEADPLLSYASLENSALAYADGLDLTDPRVSPLYADFGKGFSPSLITESTKCIFLSTSVRLYQALEAAGQKTKLDVYEGLWHVFQHVPIPESELAIRKSAAFINKHLR